MQKQLQNFNFTEDMFSIKHIVGDLDTTEGNMSDILTSLKDEDFTQTLIGHGTEEVLNTDERSSKTHQKTFNISNEEVDIDIKFKLIKYEKGDFFEMHKDSHGTHTCLIFCPSEFKGGDLILKKNDLWELRFKPDTLPVTKDGEPCYTVLIFSTDFLHEVTPITEGVRYVLKGVIENEDSEEEYENVDWGGGLDGAYGSGDY